MRPYKLKLNGKEVTPEEFHKKGPVGGNGIPMGTCTYQDHAPLISEGLGCMKSQVSEMREAIRERGIQGAHVRDSGQIEFTSRQARADVCHMRGLADADGGYSDG